MQISLRPVQQSDLDHFFDHQQDSAAVWMAAFTSVNSGDRDAFDVRWARILDDPTIVVRTIEHDGTVAGHLLKYLMAGVPEISYWIGREFWGQGVTSTALRIFLDEIAERPIGARAAQDNVASIAVLQKNGFTIVGAGSGPAEGRGRIVEEYLLKLNAPLGIQPQDHVTRGV